ncbi:MAG: hypothetical protein NZ866_03075, partial [Patescibacteria group bacterium]|nr:hypothetical protein [Patescibacteria group bacterium]
MPRQPTKPKQGFNKKETKKTINKKEKGDRAEREVKKIFENSGWQVYKPVRTKFNPKDIFGVGDLLAIKLYQKPHLIQVKTNKKDINFDQAIKQ